MNDLISRQAAIDALVKHSYLIRYDFGFTSIENGMTITGIKQALSELPSAERRGHWIKHGEPPWYVIECSECGAKWHMSGSWDANNFCGNCGAKMGEGE